jgi:sigma-B regulation protein RsbU (phosphoserine phosphatase)
LAGHPPIIRIRNNGELDELKITQLPLLTLLNTKFSFDNLTTESGDMFIIYSDGITETTKKKGEEFGFERLFKILQQTYSLNTREISDRVYKALDEHGSSRDDQSLIIIRKK